jgi:hypothetical protein
MTAINVLRLHDRVVLATDGASYDPDDGTVLAFINKAWPVAHWPGVVTCRGDSLAGPLLAFVLGNTFGSFDAFVAGIEGRAEDIHDRVAPYLDTVTDVDLVAAGWSADRQRPESFYMRLGSQEVPGMTDSQVKEAIAAGSVAPDAYRLTELPRRAFGPNVTGLGVVDTDAMDEGELFAFLRDVLERQRADPFDPGNGEPPFSIVGGHATATVITAEGVSQRVFHRWPDVVGERIEVGALLSPDNCPEKIAGLFNGSPMSRLRAEMAARKAAKARRHG